VASFTQQSRQRVPQSTENAQRPHEFRRYDGMTSWWPAADRRWRLCAILDTGTKSAALCRGKVPMRQRRVKMMTLYLTRSGTSSQWREIVMHQLRQAAVNLPRTSYQSERSVPNTKFANF